MEQARINWQRDEDGIKGHLRKHPLVFDLSDIVGLFIAFVSLFIQTEK